MDDPTKLTIRAVSKQLGVNSQRLRRYCNLGLVPGYKWSLDGRQRTFTPDQVDWLKQAVFLSRAGFTTKDLRKYIQLAQKSPDPAAKREQLAMLRTHKRQVWQTLENLQATIDFCERQEELLTEREEGV